MVIHVRTTMSDPPRFPRMSDLHEQQSAWFAGLDPDDLASAAAAIRGGGADQPHDWPALAIDSGYVESRDDYYTNLRTATISAIETAIDERAAADDERVKQQIRALDDVDRVANELAERVAEWATATGTDLEYGIDGVVALARDDVDDPRMADLAAIVADLRDEREVLHRDIERGMHDVAPNLTALAGPLLGARLIAIAGSLEALAKMPSGTVQLLGAEDALFAHLTEGTPPPKHGLIYTHEYVRGTRPAERGSAARAVAGKLAIAARIDHYSGDYRPTLETELRERIDRIRERDQ